MQPDTCINQALLLLQLQPAAAAAVALPPSIHCSPMRTSVYRKVIDCSCSKLIQVYLYVTVCRGHIGLLSPFPHSKMAIKTTSNCNLR